MGAVKLTSSTPASAILIDTRVRDGGVVYLTRYGRRVGAVVPAEVLDRNEPTVPWEEAITELEIGDAGPSARSSR